MCVCVWENFLSRFLLLLISPLKCTSTQICMRTRPLLLPEALDNILHSLCVCSAPHLDRIAYTSVCGNVVLITLWRWCLRHEHTHTHTHTQTLIQSQHIFGALFCDTFILLFCIHAHTGWSMDTFILYTLPAMNRKRRESNPIVRTRVRCCVIRFLLLVLILVGCIKKRRDIQRTAVYGRQVRNLRGAICNALVGTVTERTFAHCVI